MPELLDEGYSVNWASYDVTPATPDRLHHSSKGATASNLYRRRLAASCWWRQGPEASHRI
jgi:hypothetical protein